MFHRLWRAGECRFEVETNILGEEKFKGTFEAGDTLFATQRPGSHDSESPENGRRTAACTAAKQ